ncbi:Tat pathway signal protein [Streptomyces sp. OF3]|uniref:Tat pathway signal protein n=1 Tax=Streptomyces alkaliterrae TaxID=2213162 RepID=A0A7W3WIU7_9ACTN|nr:Tat pathway signal protein [Streptomyces alkaliterrae]MBB1253141.1 Tat pathway signal protein [Streptomyces alkaliterrae]
MAPAREPNTALAQVIAETGLTNAALAHAVRRVAWENGETVQTNKSTVTHWVRYGVQPSGNAGRHLAEALSRRLGRVVTLREIGLPEPDPELLDWRTDTLSALADLGRIDTMDIDRRQAMGTAAYSLAALTLPGSSWWTHMADHGRTRRSGRVLAGQGDLDAARDMAGLFSTMDQRHGGGHARTAVVRYLTTEVSSYLNGTFSDDRVRRGMFSTAAELAYLSGWMAFDNGEHATAQKHFTVAVKLAAEADDSPMAAHILRAMAHQANDLGHPKAALDLASASVEGKRYAEASPRERALLGVVHARGLASTGQKNAAVRALLRAEDDLAAARHGDGEPGRVFFFQEASLAHQTGLALRDTGDLSAAEQQLQRSVRTRKATTFTRTHAVTLGYLGSVQARQHRVEEACSTWSAGLDAMTGVRSARTRQAAVEMRAALSSLRQRGIRAVTDVDTRAAAYLAATA